MDDLAGSLKHVSVSALSMGGQVPSVSSGVFGGNGGRGIGSSTVNVPIGLFPCSEKKQPKP